jgi:hypothetical protein
VIAGIVWQDHFYRDFPNYVTIRINAPGQEFKDKGRERAGNQYKLFQDWTSGRMPRVIVMRIQHPTPYFDDSHAVNSANQGP